MAIMLAGLELDAVTVMSAAEERHIIAHHIPGLPGDVLQDIGRGPAFITVDGVLHGSNAHQDAETLRTQFRNGAPVELVAPLATTLEVQQVIIQRLDLQELASWPTIVQLKIALLEYVPPPAPASPIGGGLALDGALGGPEQGALSEWSADLEEQIAVESFANQIMANPQAAGEIMTKVQAQPGGISSLVEGQVGKQLSLDTDKMSDFMDKIPDEAKQLVTAAAKALITGDPEALKSTFVELGADQLGQLIDEMPDSALGGVLETIAPDLTGDKLAGLIKTIAKDPSRLGPALQELAASSGGLAAMANAAYNDPSSIPGMLEQLPEFLDELGMEELADSLAQTMDRLSGSDFADLIRNISELDLQQAGDLLNKLRKAGSLEDIARMLLEEGSDILDQIPGLENFNVWVALGDAVEFFDKLRKVGEEGGELLKLLKQLDPLASMRELLEELS